MLISIPGPRECSRSLPADAAAVRDAAAADTPRTPPGSCCSSDGDVHEGPYVDGKKNGNWVERAPSGRVVEGPYVDGTKHGNWAIHWPSGTVEEGPYGSGRPHGNWVLRASNGAVEDIRWVNGKRVSSTVRRRPD